MSSAFLDLAPSLEEKTTEWRNKLIGKKLGKTADASVCLLFTFTSRKV